MMPSPPPLSRDNPASETKYGNENNVPDAPVPVNSTTHHLGIQRIDISDHSAYARGEKLTIQHLRKTTSSASNVKNAQNDLAAPDALVSDGMMDVTYFTDPQQDRLARQPLRHSSGKDIKLGLQAGRDGGDAEQYCAKDWEKLAKALEDIVALLIHMYDPVNPQTALANNSSKPILDRKEAWAKLLDTKMARFAIMKDKYGDPQLMIILIKDYIVLENKPSWKSNPEVLKFPLTNPISIVDKNRKANPSIDETGSLCLKKAYDNYEEALIEARKNADEILHSDSRKAYKEGRPLSFNSPIGSNPSNNKIPPIRPNPVNPPPTPPERELTPVQVQQQEEMQQHVSKLNTLKSEFRDQFDIDYDTYSDLVTENELQKFSENVSQRTEAHNKAREIDELVTRVAILAGEIQNQ